VSSEQLTVSSKRSNVGLLLIVGMLLCTPAVADTIRLSPNEAVDRALRNNLSLESARITTATRKRTSDLSWNQFIPSVTLGTSMIINNEREKITASGVAPVPWDDRFGLLGLTRNDVETQIPGVGTMYNYVMPYSVSVNGPRWNFAIPIQTSITLTLTMLENMNRLRLDYEGGLIAYEKAKLQLERDVRKAYNNMLLLQENIALLKESFEAAERRVRLAQANYFAGLAPELTLLQAQVAMENMKPAIDQVENGFRLAMASFAYFLGLPYDTSFELIPLEYETDFIPLDMQELISKAASGKPDINELRHNILMLQSARKMQSQALLPYLNLSWGFTPVYIPKPLNTWRKTGSLTFTLGVRLHSLLPFSQDSQAVKNLDDQITAVNIGLAQMIQGTEIEVYNTVLSLDRTRTTAEAHTQTIRLAERAYQLTEQAFNAGLQDLLQVQNAQLELRQAKVSMLEQQFNYLNGLLDLEYSIGVPFGSLNPNGTMSKENP
jgi:outer membrane protein TolC